MNAYLPLSPKMQTVHVVCIWVCIVVALALGIASVLYVTGTVSMPQLQVSGGITVGGTIRAGGLKTVNITATEITTTKLTGNYITAMDTFTIENRPQIKQQNTTNVGTVLATVGSTLGDDASGMTWLNGVLTINGTVITTGNLEAKGTFAADGTASVGGSLTVNGAASVGGSLAVNGTATANALTVNTEVMAGENVYGNCDFSTFQCKERLT